MNRFHSSVLQLARVVLVSMQSLARGTVLTCSDSSISSAVDALLCLTRNGRVASFGHEQTAEESSKKSHAWRHLSQQEDSDPGSGWTKSSCAAPRSGALGENVKDLVLSGNFSTSNAKEAIHQSEANKNVSNLRHLRIDVHPSLYSEQCSSLGFPEGSFKNNELRLTRILPSALDQPSGEQENSKKDLHHSPNALDYDCDSTQNRQSHVREVVAKLASVKDPEHILIQLHEQETAVYKRHVDLCMLKEPNADKRRLKVFTGRASVERKEFGTAMRKELLALLLEDMPSRCGKGIDELANISRNIILHAERMANQKKNQAMQKDGTAGGECKFESRKRGGVSKGTLERTKKNRGSAAWRSALRKELYDGYKRELERVLAIRSSGNKVAQSLFMKADDLKQDHEQPCATNVAAHCSFPGERQSCPKIENQGRVSCLNGHPRHATAKDVFRGIESPMTNSCCAEFFKQVSEDCAVRSRFNGFIGVPSNVVSLQSEGQQQRIYSDSPREISSELISTTCANGSASVPGMASPGARHCARRSEIAAESRIPRSISCYGTKQESSGHAYGRISPEQHVSRTCPHPAHPCGVALTLQHRCSFHPSTLISGMRQSEEMNSEHAVQSLCVTCAPSQNRRTSQYLNSLETSTLPLRTASYPEIAMPSCSGLREHVQQLAPEKLFASSRVSKFHAMDGPVAKTEEFVSFEGVDTRPGVGKDDVLPDVS